MKKYFYPVVALLLIVLSSTHAAPWPPLKIKIPEQCHFENFNTAKVKKISETSYELQFKPDTKFPLSFKIADLFGAHIQRSAKDMNDLNNQEFSDGIVKIPYANPVYIETLPRLCPRAKIIQEGGQKSLVYDAALDILNERPGFQLFDPDFARIPTQSKILENFDNKNVLRITRAKITYDHEDTSILDYQGPHPITGEPHLVYEGEGGFYANFHYAVIPFDKKYRTLDRQELLNLAQGKLHLIKREDLTPKWRVHSFIPGPYLSKDQVYPLCEWGDTSFQAKKQQMTYKNLKIWDWDLDINKIMIIVWEGDEEDWLIEAKLLDPFYLTDDLVAVFVVNRADVLKPKILKNQIGNFEMEVVTE